MTYRPVTIGRRTSLAEAGRLFEELRVGGLPVTEDGRLLGVLTRLDVLKAFAAVQEDRGGSYDEVMGTPAEAVMTVEPVTLGPATPLAEALETMIVTRCGYVAVVFGALLVGILTRTDVARALRTAAGGRLGRVA